ncbi:adhesin [Pseudomonas gessardii]|uniref:adhesin n=1 Tax=Pseudomonas gessardii TaxID=78544 RepID=UPI001475061D|nr:adhesin [Pseudomonas gessardii]NNA68497.1 adhesin [Pseudomonas gessardii]NNA87995.1 adhesin [Pseudomonas gessardii]
MKHAWLILALLDCASALADSNNHALIDSSGQQYSGVASVNQAAGNQQQQINSRAITVGGQATDALVQRLDGKVDPALNASAAIQGSSFSNGNGVLGVNQSAGANNQAINAVRISINPGPQSIDDSVLSQQNMTLLPDSRSASTTGSRQVVTSDQAFTGSRGVVQVNQSAGVGNRVANTLGITIK